MSSRQTASSEAFPASRRAIRVAVRVSLGSQLILTALALGSPYANAADAGGETERLEEVEVVGAKDSALTQAPTESRLDALQPQSIINVNQIANHVVPTADFATIAALTPGVANVETNGPGLSESKHLTLRGFDDGSYNVTYDGIPFADQNDWTHHTTSYFPAKLIGRVVVDRGPGNASTIGQATFGGTIAMFSKDPREDLSFVPTISHGSWNTDLEHFELNSGLLSALNGASAIGSYQHMSTDGYRSNSDMQRDTWYCKYLQPVGAQTTLTLLSSYNTIHFSNPGTVTQQQIDRLGRDYGLSSSPLSLDYRGYNFQDKQADFEYIGLHTRLTDAWEIDNKVYTYFYDNESREKPKSKTVAGLADYLGSYKVNRYRTYGDYFILSHTDAVGMFDVGFWADYTRNPRYLYGLNYTATGNTAVDRSAATVQFKPVASNALTAASAPFYDYSYDMTDRARTLQGFTEYEWHATDALSVRGGLKYFRFTRDLEAPVNQTKARNPLNFSHTDDQTSPFLAANLLADPHWSFYAQYAQGMLSPNLNQFYVETPAANTIKPALTTNYQTGTVFKTDRLNASADVYYIDFRNYAYKGPTDPAGDPYYIGVARGAIYRGGELEATWSVGGGLSLYGNASVTRAKFKGSGLDVPTVPSSTAVVGFVFDRGGFFSSFTDKFVNRMVVYDTLTNPDVAGGGAARTARTASYWLGDLSVGYALKLDQGALRSVKLRFEVNNLFDRKVQVLDSIDPNPANAYTADAFNVLPLRSYFLTLSADL